MNTNRIFGRANIVNVIGLGEEMDCRLAVEKEEVRADGTARSWGDILSEDSVGGRSDGTGITSTESISIGARGTDIGTERTNWN
jgi:hypothetical protein